MGVFVEVLKVELTAPEAELVRQALGYWKRNALAALAMGPSSVGPDIAKLVNDVVDSLTTRLRTATLREWGEVELLPDEVSNDLPF